MHRLEGNKGAWIKDRVVWSVGEWRWNWGWLRDPRGRAIGKLDDLILLLQNFSFSNSCRDSWRWVLDEDGGFMVKTLSKEVDSKNLKIDMGSHETLSCKLVPKKVNVFVWRTLKGRLLVRTELDKRGIDLHTTLCPCCNDGVESIDHCLEFCNFSRNV